MIHPPSEHFLRYFDGVARQYPHARISPAWRSLESITRDWSAHAIAEGASQCDVDDLFVRLRRSATSASIWEPIWEAIASWARDLGLHAPALTRDEYAGLRRSEAFRDAAHRWLHRRRAPIDCDIGKGLQEAREMAGLTRGDIADKLGMPHGHVKDVEWGRARADETCVVRMLEACGVAIDFRPRITRGDSLVSIVRRRDRAY